MTSISDLVAELQNAHSQLETAQAALDAAGAQADEMIDHSAAMELVTAVESLQAVRHEITALSDAVAGVTRSTEELVATTAGAGQYGR